jgi:hypothetical protein
MALASILSATPNCGPTCTPSRRKLRTSPSRPYGVTVMLSAQDGDAGAIQPRLPGRDCDPRAAAQAKRDSKQASVNRHAVLRSLGVATRCDGHSPAAEIHLRSPCKRDGATAQLARLSPHRSGDFCLGVPDQVSVAQTVSRISWWHAVHR